MRVLWIVQGTAARDETAFRHALKTGHRLRQQGQRLTDAAIIDAYEHAYNVAHTHGGADRDNEMPSMRDRQTMARRVRGYVTQSKSAAYIGSSAPGKATSSERKALATMGRKGGKKAAEPWKTDPEGKYARGRRETLAKTHKRKKVQGLCNQQKIGQVVTSFWIETDRLPTRRAIMAETGLSEADGETTFACAPFRGTSSRVGGAHHKQYTVPLPLGSYIKPHLKNLGEGWAAYMLLT